MTAIVPIAPQLMDTPVRPLPDDVPTALSAECTCPDWCERDHDRD
jgi:hypothetical protein